MYFKYFPHACFTRFNQFIAGFFILALLWGQTRRCATMERLQYLIQQDPTILERMAEVEAQTKAYIESQRHLPY